ncbi:MAG: hypothetical protein WC657_06230 [Candidatus Paceibacterota bacterium]
MKKPSPDRKPGEITVCLDGLDEHHQALGTLAGLVALCEESGNPVVETRTVGRAGRLMLRELEQIRRWRERLAKELSR